jgi:hypothetical protein
MSTTTTGILPCSGCGQYFGHHMGCIYNNSSIPTYYPPQPPYNVTITPPLPGTIGDSVNNLIVTLGQLATTLERLSIALEVLVQQNIQNK